MAQADQQSEAERRKRAKEVYEKIIRVVDLNSGHKQPPLASKPSVVGNRCRSGYSLEEISRAITAARSNGDLFQVEDDEGRVRLGIDDDEVLLEKIETYLSRADDPREDLIGLANKRIQFLRKQGDRDE
ncbi:hypothetical protein [Natronorubrum halophilum]|uniref:hypothetical protein n=1 Tax=Natronorubrum halophilum TaxID=1702106 RepID=UPI0010C1F9C8|nr:hypothetical protein [Natronorubrum halophilum]